MRSLVAPSAFVSPPFLEFPPFAVLQAILDPVTFGVVYGDGDQIFFWYNLPPRTLPDEVPARGLLHMSHNDGYEKVLEIQDSLHDRGMTLQRFEGQNAVIVRVTAGAPSRVAEEAPAPEAAAPGDPGRRAPAGA